MLDRDRKIQEIVKSVIAIRAPKTQEDCCAIAARAAAAVMGSPREEDIFQSAWGMAAGLFGPAFKSASEAQRIAWIDMCEQAIREAKQ